MTDSRTATREVFCTNDLPVLEHFCKVSRAVLDNLYKFVVPAVAGPARLVPLPALATDDLSSNALRVAAIRGRLKGRHGG